MPFRRLPGMTVAALALTVIPVPTARADSRPLTYRLNPAWATADVTVVRSGWSVRVNGSLTDTRDDGDCVCAADALRDSCEERTEPVPAEVAAQSRYKPRLDAYLDSPMEDFKRAKAEAPEPLDWSSDGCTKSPDRPQGFDFKDACDRHDFGYRNYGQGRVKAKPTDAQREQVDLRLHGDLMNVCDHERERQKCRSIAETYFDFTRKAGGKGFYS